MMDRCEAAMFVPAVWLLFYQLHWILIIYIYHDSTIYSTFQVLRAFSTVVSTVWFGLCET